MPPRDKQHLDVEAPTIDGLQGKHVAGHFTPEDFETALRILDAGDGEDAHDEVKDAAHQVAILRLVDAARAGRFTRGDGDIVMIDRRRQEFIDLFDRH